MSKYPTKNYFKILIKKTSLKNNKINFRHSGKKICDDYLEIIFPPLFLNGVTYSCDNYKYN